MNRKEFVAAAVAALGACACGRSIHAEASAQAPENPETKALQRKVDFMQKRMALLVAALDETTRDTVLETMGRERAREGSAKFLERYRGKPQAFIDEVGPKWMTVAEYDPVTKEARLVGNQSECACAFVKPGLTPPAFCACTLGWQKEAYGIVFGEPIDVELESTVLRGGQYCGSRIRSCAARADRQESTG